MILFVEDQMESADLYLYEIRNRGLRVQHVDNVAGALRIIDRRERIEVAILDVMMPPGGALSAIATSDGLTTGLHLYKRLRARHKETFVLLLTNLSSPVVKETIRGDRKADVARKDKVLYDEIADRVEEIVRAPDKGE